MTHTDPLPSRAPIAPRAPARPSASARLRPLAAGVSALALLASPVLAPPVLAEEIVLDPILIERPDAAEGTGPATPGRSQISGAELTATTGGNLEAALNSQPGTYTRAASDNPGVTVNIRGQQSFGRVNSMIDGVPQTFRNISGHAGTLDTLVYVDPGLLAGVDITRGAVSGAAGMGTLGGAANFRTLDIADVLEDGRNRGGLLRFGGGTNGKDWSATLAGAMQHDLGQGRSFGLLAAISGFGEGTYSDGQGTDSTGGQDPRSFLLKGEFAFAPDHRLKLSAQSYDNRFAAQESSGYVWDLSRRTVSAEHEISTGALLNLSTHLYWTRTEIAFPASASTSSAFVGRDGVNTGLGFDITNRSDLSLGGLPVQLSYGVAVTSDDYEGKAGAGSNADGTLRKAGAFAEAALALGDVDLTAGLRYDHYTVKGATAYDATGNQVISEATRKGGEWNPSLKLTWNVRPEATLFASYARTMRAPTAQEMFYPGTAHTTWARVAAPNLDLEAETADTFEIGGSWEGRDLWASGDSLSLAATLFRSDIENYITYGTFGNYTAVTWVNTDGTTRMSGLELEARYDAPEWFGGLSLTIADTSKPLGAYGGMTASTAELPDDYATLELGRKWRDGALRTGLRVRYTGPSTAYPMIYTTPAFSMGAPIPVKASTVLDVFATWKVSDRMDLYASIENVTDRYYQVGNVSFNEAEDGLGGRGRTIQVGGQIRF
ncbi:TonB-dependent receptor domain-containing protein [Phaeovulum vinaykumarii]|uniref:Hemoglobin/transferrin/lactoferrin receptor protein n=1 Tax=Phaeovulum vinaykumarii TaxID=407234 RepID=A0A1N7JLB9_9RHOB|nr:TonB-dependent receptor [Phaeovulum vinaykumarii]SIS50138.1 hemoglobin/transferrin/lactoferrin receptor protein [Phaeovulum vinaykumarii]SOB90118.1 hemoglobin/transferrin/lactoferrin receptor protein [Phaeovulum vinaykumarii]